MSGPKVVRIVTREELEAICKRLLQAADDAAGELRHCAQQHGVLDETFASELERRQVPLRRLLQEERWQELQKQVPREIAFLRTEMERIRTQAMATAEAARSKRRRMEGAARTLLSALKASDQEPPRKLLELVPGIPFMDDRALSGLQSVLNEAFQQLAPTPARTGPSAAQRELSARLRAGESGQSLTEWLAAQPPGASHASSARLDALIAEVETLEGAEAARPLIERAAAVASEPSENRRALLTDSLVLDIAAHCQLRRRHEAEATRLRELQGALASFESPAARGLHTRIATVLQSGRWDDTSALIRQAQEQWELETRALAAAARRRAVLNGLSALGYEVRETLAAAWAEDGRVVVRKPGTADYGVELGAPADAARMQVRVVGSDRPSTPRDAGRDRDAETLWCGEFQRLSQLLAGSGTHVELERALEAGAQPVKTISFETAGTEEQRGEKTPGLRTVR